MPEEPTGRRFQTIENRIDRSERAGRQDVTHLLRASLRLVRDDRVGLGYECLVIGRRPCGDEQRQDHSGQRGVHSPFVDAEPQRQAEKRIGSHPVHGRAVKRRQDDDDQRRRGKELDVQALGIE